MTTLDQIDDITPQFRPVLNDLSGRLWAMLGTKNPDDFTGVVTVQGGNFQIGLAPCETNLLALEAMRDQSDQIARLEAIKTIDLLRLPRKPLHLRLLIASPQAVLVLDVPQELDPIAAAR